MSVLMQHLQSSITCDIGCVEPSLLLSCNMLQGSGDSRGADFADVLPQRTANFLPIARDSPRVEGSAALSLKGAGNVVSSRDLIPATLSLKNGIEA